MLGQTGLTRSPEVAGKFTALGADPQFGTPAEFAAYVAADYAKWANAAKDASLEPSDSLERATKARRVLRAKWRS